MTINKKEFYNELTNIQKKYGRFFALSERKFIKIITSDNMPKLIFTKNSTLDEAIRMEIRLLFKLIKKEEQQNIKIQITILKINTL